MGPIVWTHKDCDCMSCYWDKSYKPRPDEAAFICIDGYVRWRRAPPVGTMIWYLPIFEGFAFLPESDLEKYNLKIQVFRCMRMRWPSRGWPARIVWVERGVLPNQIA